MTTETTKHHQNLSQNSSVGGEQQKSFDYTFFSVQKVDKPPSTYQQTTMTTAADNNDAVMGLDNDSAVNHTSTESDHSPTPKNFLDGNVADSVETTEDNHLKNSTSSTMTISTTNPPPHDHLVNQIRQRKTGSASPEDKQSSVATPPVPVSLYNYDQMRGNPTIEHTEGSSTSQHPPRHEFQVEIKKAHEEYKLASPKPAIVVAPFNNPAKKIYFNKTFIESIGLSYATVQRQQIQQQKNEEQTKDQDLRNMSINNSQDYEKFFDGGYATSHVLEEEEEDHIEQYEHEISDDLQTSTTKTSWSEYIAHHKNAFSLVRVIASQWSWGEMTLGLEYYTRHQSQTVRDFTQFMSESDQYHDQVTERDLHVWKRYARFNYQVFREPVASLPKKTNIGVDSIICFDKTQQTMRPAYFLLLDHATGSLVLIFRGTKSFSDLITDLHCSSIRYRHGYCHKGILCAAQWFRNNTMLKKIIRKALERYPEYKLVLCGHSLGGGTAAILTDLWKDENEFPGVDIHCYAFACPPVLSHVLAVESASYITTFVNGDDFVTRLSMTAIEELRKDVSAYPWKDEMMRDIQNSAIVKFASGVKNVASGIFSKGVGLFYKKSTTQQANAISTDEEMESYATIYPKIPENLSDQQIMDYISRVSLDKSDKRDNNNLVFPPLPIAKNVVETVASEIAKDMVETAEKENGATTITTTVDIIANDQQSTDADHTNRNTTEIISFTHVSSTEPVTLNNSNVKHEDEAALEHDEAKETENAIKEVKEVLKEEQHQIKIIDPKPTTTTANSSNNTGNNTNGKKNKKKKKANDNDSPFIINDYENLVVGLYPAGKIYQMRNINSKVYIKESGQEEFNKLILSETWKEDHRMIHYLRNLEYFTEFKRKGNSSREDDHEREDIVSPVPSPVKTLKARKQQAHFDVDNLPPIPAHLINNNNNNSHNTESTGSV